MRDRPWVLLALVPVVLFVAAVYELFLALRGSYSGLNRYEQPAGESWFGLGAVFAMLVGMAAAALHAVRPRAPSVVALFAPAAAAFVTASFYTYDPYYGPSLRRYSNGGAVPAGWIFFVLALSLVAGVLTRLRPRVGSAATAVLLPLLLVTDIFAMDGH